MADFTTQDVGADIAQAVGTPLPGVESSSGASATAIASFAANTAGLAADLFTAVGKKTQETAQSKVVAAHVINIGSIANAVDQGKMSSNEAQTRLRALTSSVIASNPSLTDDIQKATKNAVNQTGFGHIIDAGTEQEQRVKKDLNAAADAMFITSGMTEAETQEGLTAYKNNIIHLRQMSTATKEIALASARGSFEKELASQKAQTVLKAFGTTNFVPYRNRMATILKGFEQSGDAGVAEAQIRQEWTKVKQFASENARAGGPVIDEILGGYEQLKDDMLGMISGKFAAEAMGNKVKSIENSYKLQALNDPQIGRLVGVIQTMGGAQMLDPTWLTLAAQKANVAGFISGATKGEPVTDVVPSPTARVDNKGGNVSDAYFGFTNNIITNVNNGPESKVAQTKEQYNETKSIANNMVTSMFRSVVETPFKEDPKGFTEVMAQLAQASTGIYMSGEEGVRIDATLAQQTSDVLKNFYQQKIIPLIRDEFKTSSVTVPKFGQGSALPKRTEVPTQEAVEIIFDGIGIKFTPVNPDSREAADKSRRLNQTVSPHLNQWLRVNSHLAGSMDYKKAWEEEGGLKEALFPEKKLGGGEGDDTLAGGGPLDDRNPEPQEARAEFRRQAEFAEQEAALRQLEEDDEVNTVAQQVKDALLGREGTGDTLTGISTGIGGITSTTKKTLEKELGRSLSDKEAREAYVDKQFNLLNTKMDGFSDLPQSAQIGLTDLAFNIGPKVVNFSGLKAAVKAGDVPEAMLQTLDTAVSEGHTVKGIAKRRAELYNIAIPNDPITKIVQEDDGTIIYMKGSDEFFRFNTKKGKHKNSRAGEVTL